MKRAKPRTKKQLFRKAKKESYSGDLHLIVTEGTKTEPDYFKDLLLRWRIAAQIEGAPSGNSPDTLVDYAVEKKRARQREASRHGPPSFNKVWCVFDHDNHPTLKAALDKAKANKVQVVLSVPCFEIWFLLHFGYSAKPFANCDDVIREINLSLSSTK